MSEREYVNEEFSAAEESLALASQYVSPELGEIHGFLTDYNLRVAQVQATLSVAVALAELNDQLHSREEVRQDEAYGNSETVMARIANALERIERK